MKLRQQRRHNMLKINLHLVLKW